ncbi:phosphotransferase enzyme family protein [Paenibacillus sp. SAF-054]|uniref:phosphotransferase enzyme family protein n=1 Tax=unclassified Paenibacillus TaxID=185978 RepID=UPI003F807A19
MVFISDEGIEKAIMQYKQAALKAIQHYDIDWDRIRFNQLSDTCTFVLETSKSETLLLRIHVETSGDEIDSELFLLDSLHNKIDVVIPKGILNRHGSRTTKIDLENGYQCNASLMRWVEGEHDKGGLTDNQIFREGVLLAKLHQASQNVELTSNFKRPTWDEHSFRLAITRLTKYYNRFLNDAEFQLYLSAAEQISAWMSMRHKDRNSYGLIHGDLHQGNIIFHHGEPRPIDFGRCGFGYFIYDIAHTILGLYPVQRELVIKGYESIRYFRHTM